MLTLALAVQGMLRASAAIYEVGPEKPFTTIGTVPWTSLAPGDTVLIDWRPQAYHEKILVSCRGTASLPINIVGVPGPAGQLPVIDGQDATTDSQFHFPYPPTQDRGVIILSLNRQQQWGFKPGYILIQGLDVRDAYTQYSYTDGQGLPRSYSGGAAAIWIERGEHIVVKGCAISGSNNGFFVSSGGSEQNQSRDITLDGCAVYGNGTVGGDRQHNIYTEAIGVVFQYNHLGRLRPGALGNNLKDRSAGTVVRYNWIEGGAHMLDLVEAQDSWPITGQDPSYHQCYVYGNTFLSGPSDGTYLVHYGGDNGDTSTYRKGTLYFYHNTLWVQANQTGVGGGGRWSTIALQLATNDETADVRNNIFFNQSTIPGVKPSQFCLMNLAGAANFGVNWINPGWTPSAAGYWPFTGAISGTGNFINGADPGFVDDEAPDVHLASGSPAAGRGGVLSAALPAQYGVTSQYLLHQGVEPRTLSGAGADLGAFQSKGARHLFSVRGRLTASGRPLGWAKVWLGSASAVTAPDGTYSFLNVPVGTYAVSASASFYYFGPARSLQLQSDVVGVDFSDALVPASITLGPGTVSGGGRVTGVVVLNAAAPDGGAYVPLFLQGSAISTPAQYVFVPAGATSASFPVSTQRVPSATTAAIKAYFGGTYATSNVLTITR